MCGSHNRFINELLEHILKVLNIRYYPIIQLKVSKFQSFKVSKFQSSKAPKFQNLKNSKIQNVKCPKCGAQISNMFQTVLESVRAFGRFKVKHNGFMGFPKPQNPDISQNAIN